MSDAGREYQISLKSSRCLSKLKLKFYFLNCVIDSMTKRSNAPGESTRFMGSDCGGLTYGKLWVIFIIEKLNECNGLSQRKFSGKI